MSRKNVYGLCAHAACNCQDDVTALPGATPREAVSRRDFFCGAIGTALAAGALAASSNPSLAQSALTPDAALQELKDGNKRYVAGKLQSLGEDLEILKAKTAEKQEPFAAILSCADSRVPVEFVFDQSIGQLFVARIAGNITTPEIIASLEYGVAVLGTKVIVVLGHTNCGAVKATIEAKAVPGQIGALYAPIWPAVKLAGPDLTAVIDANAKFQATLLSQASPIIAEGISAGSLKVAAACYDIASGTVAWLS